MKKDKKLKKKKKKKREIYKILSKFIFFPFFFSLIGAHSGRVSGF